METDTNPIDRSIAHLLFHRPSDPSMVPNDESSLKSQNMVSSHTFAVFMQHNHLFHDDRFHRILFTDAWVYYQSISSG